MKPRLFRRGLYWWCMDGTACTAGCSPAMAYDQWRKLRSAS